MYVYGVTTELDRSLHPLSLHRSLCDCCDRNTYAAATGFVHAAAAKLLMTQHDQNLRQKGRCDCLLVAFCACYM